MARTIYKILILLLLPLSWLLNKLYTSNPTAWEAFYSMGINKKWIESLSRFFGLFPFSVFELSIYITVIALLYYVLATLIKCFKEKTHPFKFLFNRLLSLACFFAIMVFVFTTFWGLNYNRPHFSNTYGLTPKPYTSDELGAFYSYLLKEAASIRETLPKDANGDVMLLGDTKDVLSRAHLGFEVAGKGFPSLTGNYGRPKTIQASKALTRTGITGIYSPFTGEPNINTHIPLVTLPSTACHELAHQRGYGFESECNFIAYITALSHPDADFKYSGLIMAISYTSNALATVNLDLLKTINTEMDSGVYQDLVGINTFWNTYNSTLSEVSEKINDTYLKSNGVASGTASYGEMVDLILALYDKYN